MGNGGIKMAPPLSMVASTARYPVGISSQYVDLIFQPSFVRTKSVVYVAHMASLPAPLRQSVSNARE